MVKIVGQEKKLSQLEDDLDIILYNVCLVLKTHVVFLMGRLRCVILFFFSTSIAAIFNAFG